MMAAWQAAVVTSRRLRSGRRVAAERVRQALSAYLFELEVSVD